mgnify:CR=1 FL=1
MPAAAADLPDPARTAQIVILGEIHDNPAHHRFQAEAVAALAPRALVFEMLDPGQAAALNALDDRSQASMHAASGWDDSGWPDFAMYHPIFAAAPDARIHGAAVPKDEVRRAVREGAAALFGADAARFGLDRPLPPGEQAARGALQARAHCDALPADLLPGMVEAQRLRDAAFARTALTALDETGPPVVVIAGTGHARRDWGIPAAIALARPDVTVMAIGQGEGEEGKSGAYDAVILAPAPARDDPCAGFAAERSAPGPEADPR